jgi:Tol biopolymer transport system component
VVAVIVGACVAAAPASAAELKFLTPSPTPGDAFNNSGNGSPSISGDGKLVAFDSDLPLVDADATPAQDVFLRNVDSGETQLVSLSSAEVQGDLPSFSPAISANGRFVAFASGATNLVKGDTNRQDDIFVRDLARGKTERIAVQGARAADAPSISDDGRYVAFESQAGKPRRIQVFVHDRKTGKTKPVSHTPSGAPGKGASYDAHISGNGRVIAFGSHADLTGGTERGTRYIYVYNRDGGAIKRLSQFGVVAGLTKAGEEVLYSSSTEKGLFLLTVKSGETTRVDGGGPDEGYAGALSSDGATVAYGAGEHMFVRKVGSDTAQQVDVTAGGEQADADAGAFGASRDPRFLDLSSDGSAVAFVSRATNLTEPATPDSLPNVYWSGPL